MASCPFCDQELEDPHALSCPVCHAEFTPPELHRYEEPLHLLDEVVEQIASGEVNIALAPSVFSHLLGAVQQILDVARDDVAENMRRLSRVQLEGVPEEARTSPLEFIQAFEELQDLVNSHMSSLRDIFAESRTLAEFEAQRPLLESIMSQLRAALIDLEQLERMSSDPLLTVVPDDPLPEEVSTSIHQFELAMGAMRLYCDSRDNSFLEKCLLHLDESRSRLKQLLMVGSLDWS